MDTTEFFEEFAELSIETKRQILQEQIDSYFSQAFAWKVKAMVLRRQKGYIAKKALREREVNVALNNAQANLESMQILLDLVDELLPIEESSESPQSEITLETLTDQMSLEEIENAV